MFLRLCICVVFANHHSSLRTNVNVIYNVWIYFSCLLFIAIYTNYFLHLGPVYPNKGFVMKPLITQVISFMYLILWLQSLRLSKNPRLHLASTRINQYLVYKFFKNLLNEWSWHTSKILDLSNKPYPYDVSPYQTSHTVLKYDTAGIIKLVTPTNNSMPFNNTIITGDFNLTHILWNSINGLRWLRIGN